jgi:hypothetical protein
VGNFVNFDNNHGVVYIAGSKNSKTILSIKKCVYYFQFFFFKLLQTLLVLTKVNTLFYFHGQQYFDNLSNAQKTTTTKQTIWLHVLKSFLGESESQWRRNNCGGNQIYMQEITKVDLNLGHIGYSLYFWQHILKQQVYFTLLVCTVYCQHIFIFYS